MMRQLSTVSTLVGFQVTLSTCAVSPAAARPPRSAIDAVSFAESHGALYVPLRDAARELGLELGWDRSKATFLLSRRAIQPSSLKTTLDGTHLIALKSLVAFGARAVWLPKQREAIVSYGAHEITVSVGRKYVQVDRPTQTLKAWQGGRLILKSKVSTGREFGSTPAGIYHAGPVKEKEHHSRIANGAYMPWSVQVKGDVFIHGFKNVPGRPVSRGCIRLPLDHGNPARWFYNWIDIGTPIQINGPHTVAKLHQITSRR